MSISELTRIITADENISLPQTAGVIQRVNNTSVKEITVTYVDGEGTTASQDIKPGRHADFWYDGSAWAVSAELTRDDVEKIRSGDLLSGGKADIYITTQDDFNLVFTGTIAENTSIFIKKLNDDTPYLLNNEVTLGSGVRITSNGAIVNRGTATARFVTTFRNSAAYSSGGAIGDTTITHTAGTPFEAGDIISWSHEEFYIVVSDTTTTDTAGTVTISPAIHTTAASGTIYAYTRNIRTEGWTFDGQNDVNGLGGSFTSGFSGSGGAFYVSYCAESQFLAKVQNCKVTESGGAFSGYDNTFNNDIGNISNCSAGTGGGGCSFCRYSTIYNISYCNAYMDGGGCWGCDYSKIYNICYCSANFGGGGCSSCHYSIITNITYCSAQWGGGCSECYYSTITNITYCSSTTSGGGGCAYCHYSTITGITNCFTGTDGGGCEGCDYSIISEIINCSAGTGGGGCAYCRHSTITGITNCSAGISGGGCYNCTYSTISQVTGCSATNGGGCMICNYSIISGISDCTASTGTTDAAGGVQDSTYITLQGYFDNEGYVDNIGGCTYMGNFVYQNNAGTLVRVNTVSGLTSDDCH